MERKNKKVYNHARNQLVKLENVVYIFSEIKAIMISTFPRVGIQLN